MPVNLTANAIHLEINMPDTPATTTPPTPAAAHVEDALDEALEESFPASDPVAISDGKLDKPAGTRPANP